MNLSYSFNADKTEQLKERFREIFQRKPPPQTDDYLRVVDRANEILEHENEEIRPYDASGMPGGIVYLKRTIPTIIVPDIHARIDFFLSIMLNRDLQGSSTLEKLAQDLAQVVCVGDGFHAERRAAARWDQAFEEFRGGYKKHKHMDEEMRESLGVMEMVMEVKSAFPDNFHFLKGNHENIANEQGEGNYPFRKYAYEGHMVLEYVEKFYGEDFLDSYYTFEKNLPLLAVGKNFLVSHCEPMTFFDREMVIEYRSHPEVVEGLTWTDNGAAEKGSVIRMVEHYIDPEYRERSSYFGGHRPVRELYNQRAGGMYVQIHNPDKFIIAFIQEDKDIDLSEDIIEIEKSREITNV